MEDTLNYALSILRDHFPNEVELYEKPTEERYIILKRTYFIYVYSSLIHIKFSSPSGYKSKNLDLPFVAVEDLEIILIPFIKGILHNKTKQNKMVNYVNHLCREIRRFHHNISNLEKNESFLCSRIIMLSSTMELEISINPDSITATFYEESMWETHLDFSTQPSYQTLREKRVLIDE